MSLDAAGLVVFANLSTIGQRTALTGSSTLLDALFLCPGIHRQQNATNMNGSEYPAAAAMTSGYVFLAEGQATVFCFAKPILQVLVQVPRSWQRHLDLLYRVLGDCVDDVGCPCPRGPGRGLMERFRLLNPDTFVSLERHCHPSALSSRVGECS